MNSAMDQGIRPSTSFELTIIVPESAIDLNGHVNNVAYVEWMQDIAIEHAEVTGGTAATHAMGCTWVARSHQIEYLAPAYLKDEILLRTWVENFRRVQSIRKYSFTRIRDDKLLACGETNWVLVDSKSGRPQAISDAVRACFLL